MLGYVPEKTPDRHQLPNMALYQGRGFAEPVRLAVIGASNHRPNRPNPKGRRPHLQLRSRRHGRGSIRESAVAMRLGPDRWSANAIASSPVRHTLLTVSAGTPIGIPPLTAACRAAIWPAPPG
jgi:hypothetical protein